MQLEHVALNVADPVKMADWYVKNLGLKVAMKLDKPPHTHFLVDSGGKMMLEIYNNPPDQVPDYGKMNPLLLHVAFVSHDPDTDKALLTSAGASIVEEIHMDDGSHIVMLRDPWGLAIQLCKRGRPMVE